MKEDFLVIDHNDILRVLFIKYNTLLKLQEYSNNKSKNIKKLETTDLSKVKINSNFKNTESVENVLKENVNLNTILDEKSNDVNIDIISPGNMVTIELNENVGELENKINEIETNKENKKINNEEFEDEEANAKCVSGCNSCNNGCSLMMTGIGYICDCIGYYFNKMCNKINKMFN
jgi:hypothetical protein